MDSQTLVNQLQQLALWPDEDAARTEVLRLQQKLPDGQALGRELLARNLLTPYQANQILTGKGRALAVGPYRIEERLGAGASAQVFKARHSRHRRVVALKVIRPEWLRDNPLAVERFLREAEAAAALDHPNVVRAYDVGHDGDIYYFAMQFLDGVDLARLVEKRGRLAVEQACDYVRQAGRGLQHIHEHGMVHRDVKPSNLMVTQLPGEGASDTGQLAVTPHTVESAGPWGQVKILDLGLARLDEDPTAASQRAALTRLGTVMGTPDYMAPEQALHSRNADIRSDIYSLGCTFYFALTGVPPFPGGEAIEKMLKHQLDEPMPVEARRAEVPVPLRAILNRMMAKKKEDRYETPGELVRALEQYLQPPAPAALAAESPAAPAAAETTVTLPPSHVPATPAPSAPPPAAPAESNLPPLIPSPLVRVPSRGADWGLYLLLAAACIGAIVCLAVAVRIVLR